MQSQDNQESSVKELTEHYRSIVNRVGEQSGREILSGAKKSALGIMNPENSEAVLKLYEAVEKNLFGQVSPQSQPPKAK